MDLLRRPLERLGYVLWRREFIRYGVDPFLDVQRLAAKWALPVSTVFDVGANIGQTAREVLQAFPSARVYSFEPFPQTFARLREIKDPRFEARQLALGETIGEATMYAFGEAGDATHRNSLVDNAPSSVQFGFSANQITVPCTTLDAFCEAENIQAIEFLKIDVEGFELSVLKGAERMLAEGRISFVYAEFNNLTPIEGATGGSLLPLGEYLSAFGMKFVATYTDFLIDEGELFVVANALWARQPTH